MRNENSPRNSCQPWKDLCPKLMEGFWKVFSAISFPSGESFTPGRRKPHHSHKPHGIPKRLPSWRAQSLQAKSRRSPQASGPCFLLPFLKIPILCSETGAVEISSSPEGMAVVLRAGRELSAGIPRGPPHCSKVHLRRRAPGHTLLLSLDLP